MSSRYFALTKLRIKRNKCFKFYHLLILLAGPSQYLPDNDNKFEPFRIRGLHFLLINVNSLLLKLNEIRWVEGHTTPAILGITESKFDSSVSDQEVIWVVIAFLGATEIHMAEVLLATLGIIYALIGEIFSQIQLRMNFPIYLFQS